MSNRHDVIIWDASEYEVANDYHQAVHQARALAHQKAEPSDVLLCFVSDLKSRSQDETLEPAVVEYLQQVEDKFTASNTAALMLALPEYEPHWRSIMDILIEEVSMYKLVLCDEALQLVFLPDDSILAPLSLTTKTLPAIDQDSSKDFPSSLKQFHKTIKTKVDVLFGEHGFVLVDEFSDREQRGLEYHKAFKTGKLSLSIYYQDGLGGFKPDIFFKIIENNINAIVKQSDFSSFTRQGGVSVQLLGLFRSIDECIINNWKTFGKLLYLLNETVLHWSDAIEDTKNIDSLLNGDIDAAFKNYIISSLYTPYALIAARLAGNPNFEELALSLGAYGPDSGRNWGRFNESEIYVAWQKLVKYLQKEIKPLADWPDGFTLPTHSQSDLQSSILSEDTKEFSATIEQFYDSFKTRVQEPLIEHGFVVIENIHAGDYFRVTYDKTVSKFKFFLTISCERRRRLFYLNINFSFIEENMISIAQKSDFKYSMENGGGIFFNLNDVLQLQELLCINGYQKLEELSILLQTSILKWSGAITNIKDIDALINGEMNEAIKNYVQSSVYAPYALIAARLANNPNFDKLAISLGTYGAGSGRAWGKFSHAEVAAAWPKLVKYLRDEVKPLI